MALTFVSGGNFSGRSAHLRARAGSAGGLYLHPDLELNLSGLAETVGGERFLHGAEDARVPQRLLKTLSGGERASLVLDCTLAQPPAALAIDCALEQLDTARRGEALERLTETAADRPVWIADNRMVSTAFLHVEAAAASELPMPAGFNSALVAAAEALRPSGDAPIIRATRLNFTYPRAKSPVFAGANFSLLPGSVYLLKAPNGAGKSTLARLLVGVLQPNSGRLDCGGARLDPVNRPFFYAFQNARDQIFGRTLIGYLEDVARFGLGRATDWRQEWSDPRAVLAAFGLTAFIDLEIWDLPPIALKRLGLAAAFASRAPWLFLDEPALGLDAEGRTALAGLLATTAACGRGVIAVSHGDEFDSIPGVQRLTIADRVLRAEGGR